MIYTGREKQRSVYPNYSVGLVATVFILLALYMIGLKSLWWFSMFIFGATFTTIFLLFVVVFVISADQKVN